MGRVAGSLSPAVTAARGQIEAWRKNRRHRRESMPESLWATAVKLAEAHGINPISDALGLDYCRLKGHISGRGNRKKREAATPAFVDFGVGTLPGSLGCILELEGVGGSKLTIRLPDSGNLDVVALAEILWRSRR